MGLYYTLPVYRDTYRMILMIFRTTKELPREYKYSLGQDLRRDSMQLVRHIYRANSAQGAERAAALQRFGDDFELVRLQLRLCFDLRLIPTKPFAEITETMETISKQIAGWRRTVSKAEQNGGG